MKWQATLLPVDHRSSVARRKNGSYENFCFSEREKAQDTIGTMGGFNSYYYYYYY